MAIAKRSTTLTTLLLVYGSLLLTASAAQAACTKWNVDGRWQLVQNNGFTVEVTITQRGTALIGSASSNPTNNPAKQTNTGRLNGTINGSVINFDIHWGRGSNSIGVYSGSINERGRIQGHTYDKSHPTSATNWHSVDQMLCQ